MADVPGDLDAVGQAELVRRGEATPAELVEAAIERIERLDPELHAVLHRRFERAREEARSAALANGPFRGVPMLLKDLLAHSAGDPYWAGMRVLGALDWHAESDTHLVRRLREAGFVFVGRTNTPELGSVPTTEPDAFPATLNPWDLGRSAGGSSGGSAAAVAARMVAVAHGNDGGGSIRIPASACGIVGLKPSRGRVSLGPDVGESWAGLTAELVVTRSVRDTAALLDVLAGAECGDPYVAPPPARPFRDEVGAPPGRLRIGLMADAPNEHVGTHPDCSAAARDVAALLASLGHDVEEARPAALGDSSTTVALTRVLTACTARDLDAWSARIGRPIEEGDVEPLDWTAAQIGRGVTGAQYVLAVEELSRFARRVCAWWQEGFDLLLTPTLAEPPPPLGEFRAQPGAPLRGWMRAATMCCFTQPFNVTGQPAISLPLCWNGAGLPIGVQLVAAYGREDVLLRVAAQLEAARPWAGRRPRVCA